MKIRTRLFVEQALSGGLSITLESKAAHYLISVMRLKQGEYVALFNGTGGEWLAEFSPLSRRECVLHIRRALRPQPPTPAELKLYFAPLKKTPLDFLMQKATELGVTHFQPVITQYTHNEKIKPERLKAQIIEACEQCERLDIPTFSPLITFAEFIASLSAEKNIYYGDETGKGEPIHHILQKHTQKDISFLIGPEGGFSMEEFAILKQAAYIKALSLGPYILRAETAAIAAIVASRLYLNHWEKLPDSMAKNT